MKQEKPKKEKLTDHQKMIYNYAKNKIKENGYSPTIREIAKDLASTRGSVQYQLAEIKRKGWINFEYGKSRTIVVL